MVRAAVRGAVVDHHDVDLEAGGVRRQHRAQAVIEMRAAVEGADQDHHLRGLPGGGLSGAGGLPGGR
jgi:hypothetical protein